MHRIIWKTCGRAGLAGRLGDNRLATVAVPGNTVLVDDVPTQLDARLSRLTADLHLDLLDPAGAVRLACDLLVADVATPALIELAGESPTYLTRADAEPLDRQMLTELGMQPLDTLRASWTVAGTSLTRVVEVPVNVSGWPPVAFP